MVREQSINVGAASGAIPANVPIQLNKEDDVAENATKEGTCTDNTPLMVVLCLISVSLLVPIGVLTSKIRNADK